MVDDIRSALEQLDKEWKDTAPAQGGGGGLPSGKVQLQLCETKSGRALVSKDSDGGIRARVGVEVINHHDEEFIGRRGSKSWTLVNGDGAPNEMGMSILKQDLKVLGIDDVDNLPATKIEPALEDCIGSVVDATVQHKTDSNGIERENVYFNSLAKSSPGKKAAPAAKASKKSSRKRAY